MDQIEKRNNRQAVQLLDVRGSDDGEADELVSKTTTTTTMTTKNEEVDSEGAKALRIVQKLLLSKKVSSTHSLALNFFKPKLFIIATECSPSSMERSRIGIRYICK